MYGHVITKFSGMGRLPYLWSYAHARASRARRSSAIKERMVTWHGIPTGNFVVNVDWKELIASIRGGGGGGSYSPYILLVIYMKSKRCSHNLQSDQQGSCQRICLLIVRIKSKSIDQRSWKETKTWLSKAGLFLSSIAQLFGGSYQYGAICCIFQTLQREIVN